MIVIIPCWRRPAHLMALLRTIENAREADRQRYLFMIDRGASSAIEEIVIPSFKLQDQIAAVVRLGDHGYHGPAFNILRGWGFALGMRGEDRALADPVGLLEEDLLVAEDIFEFWQDALNIPGHIGVSACRNQNVATPTPSADSDDAAWYLHSSYQSLAVALWPYLIERVLVHARRSYFEAPSAYIARRLYDAGLPPSACSQDALFHRVIRREGLMMLYPSTPRACHVGWYGYNRREGREPQSGYPVAASLHQQAEWILGATSDQMNDLADPRFRDIERCDLIRPRTSLKLF